MRYALAALAVVLFAFSDASAQTGVSRNYAVTVEGDTLRSGVRYVNPLLAPSYVTVDGEQHATSEFQILYLDGVTHAVVDDGRKLAPLVNEGRLRLFSRTMSPPPGMVQAGPNDAVMMPLGTGQSIGYIQVPGGPVQRASLGNLRSAMGDNAESMRHLDRARTLRTFRWVATAAGIAAFGLGAYGALNAESTGGDPATFVPIGVAGALTAGAANFIFPAQEDRARDRAIDVYNAANE